MSGSGIGAEARRRARPVETPVVEAPSLAEAKKQATASDGPSNDANGKGGVPERWSFSLEYFDGRDRRWSGEFETKALTFRERVTIGLTKSRLAGGVLPNQLDAYTSHLLEMLAHLAVALVKVPEWAKDLEGLRDPGVVTAIYKEVVDHEARFHGTRTGDSGEKSDASGSGDAGESLALTDG